MNDPSTNQGLLLTGLDGSNPLAFLAALGTLRTLTLEWPNRNVKMAWTQHSGAWRPAIRASPQPNADQLLDALRGASSQLDQMVPSQLRCAGENASPKNKKGEAKWAGKLRFPPEAYREYSENAASRSSLTYRADCEFAAVWASPVVTETVDKVEVVVRTTLDFTAGNQAFIQMVSELIETCTHEDLQQCLFDPWRYQEDAISLRWDPIDDTRRYALQAIDPTNNSKNPILGVPGANRLALEALPLFPSVPQQSQLHTTGFGHIDRHTVWSWPVWNAFLELNTVRSLIAHPQLHRDMVDRQQLVARGVVDVYRVLVVLPAGRYRNFTQAHSAFGA